MRSPYNSFYTYIKLQFGLKPLNLLKTWIKVRKNIIVNKQKIRFLRNCQYHTVLPSHLDTILNDSDLNLNNCNSMCDFRKIRLEFLRKLLKLEINDSYKTIKHNYDHIYIITFQIISHIPEPICTQFFNKQSGPLFTFYLNTYKRFDKKFKRILDKQNKYSDVKPIHYFRSLNTIETTKIPSLGTVYDHTQFCNEKFTIDVEPSLFSEFNYDFSNINNKWFINLSSTHIPDNIKSFLQLGGNFSLPLTNKTKLTTEFIVNFESNLRKLPTVERVAIQNKSTNIIRSISSYQYPLNKTHKTLLQLNAITKKFLIEKQNLIITRADKGNITVALYRDKYIHEVEQLLADRETYIVVKKNPINKLISNLRELLTRWKNNQYITLTSYRSLSFSEGTLPRAYGLPKVHKLNIPFRLIVSSVNTPLYQLAVFLHKIMIKGFPNAHSFIENSFELIKKLENVHVDNDYKLISLDVVSLFTNIPIDLAIESINNRWIYIENNTDLPKSEFLQGVKFVLDSTFFTFNNTVYRQVFGTPMGSPLSPIIADIVIQDIENKALNTICFTPPFYYRFVDDIITACPSNLVDHLLITFNSFNQRLQFTLEIENKGSLNFLEITIISENNHLLFDWYHKPTFSGRYLNFLSQHPDCQKRGTIIGLFDRVFLLSHPKFHHKNIIRIIEILLNNGYPLEFIFNTINHRLLYHLRKSNNLVIEKEKEKETVNYFTVPFLPALTNKFKHILKDTNTTLSYYSLNKLNSIIKVHKDVIPKISNTNIVYKIDCDNCNASYVGQTGRKLITRINEHRKHINKSTTNKSVITEHRLNFNHDFKWDGVKVLDKETSYNKRLISEIIYIKRQCNGLNLQTDTECFPDIYNELINKLPDV